MSLAKRRASLCHFAEDTIYESTRSHSEKGMKRQCWQPSSRLIRERLLKKQQQKHVEKLLKVRSSIDMRAPNAMAIQARKTKTGDAKKQKMEAEKKTRIKKENDRLIRKLLDLDPQQRMRRYRAFNGDESEQRHQRMQLASTARRRKQTEKINSENRELLKRIVNVKATFTRQAWKSEEKRRNKLKQNLRENSMNRQGDSPRYTPRVKSVVKVKKTKKNSSRPQTAPAGGRARRGRRRLRVKKSPLVKQNTKKFGDNSKTQRKAPISTRMKRPQSAKERKNAPANSREDGDGNPTALADTQL